MTMERTFLAGSTPPLRPPDLTTPVIIGHRGMGASHRRPANPYVENTRTSFLAAHTAGARWVEMDLVPSADGDLMLHHDHFITLDGTTRPVWQVPTARLLSAGIEPLDGLHDDLPTDLGLYLELKGAPGDADPRFGPSSVGPLLDWATRHTSHRDLLVASFDPYLAARAQRHGLAGAWITDASQRFHTVVTAGVQAGLSAVVVRGNALDGPAHEVALGMEIAATNNVAVWTFHPALSRIGAYRALGVTGFCVDNVAAAVPALSRTHPAR